MQIKADKGIDVSYFVALVHSQERKGKKRRIGLQCVCIRAFECRFRK